MNQPVLAEHVGNRDELTAALSGWTTPRALPGLVADWPVVQAAQESDDALVQYLAQFDRGVTVDCLALPHQEDGRMFYNDDMSGFNFTRNRQPFQSALQQMLALAEQSEPDSLYVGSTTLDTCLPGFAEANPMPLDALAPLATLWIGNKSRIAAHYDVPDNLICVTAGKRKVTLFPPEQVENLYVGPLHFTPAGQAISLVDFKHPDYDRFPKFAKALEQALVIELEPGDALYIPSMWWHHIEGQQTMNMLVNYWWRQTPAYLGRSENALYHALLALNNLPDSQRQAWKALFNYYVFGESSRRFDHIPENRQGPLGDVDEPTLRQFKAWLANNLKQ
ncbi:cupin-like domain-containing protein [Alteromonas sp. ASW11-19]|uniref:Cupin-like domain-containing protein n=1 Tax=Alteromonas salexigens TaxID=2982530 RepID=A0ABT2VJJ0_9ALTE|nr:cupin-like domain-containing protein [Alteromonas salexigens]MCU7553400.1 cupin-like domain-containing protein [Alteromonas salexigens]